MEKKKLLIVAVSVGIVLLIMIGVPLMIINRQSTAAPTTTWHAVQSDRNLADRFGQPQIAERPMRQPEDLGQIADEADNLNLPERVAIPAPSAVPTPPPTAPAEASAATITIPTPRTAAVPDTPPAEKPAPATTAPAERPAAPPAVAAQPAARPATPAARTAAPAAKPATPAPARPATTRSNFWVQTGAFSSNARAESVKESLEAKGIVSIIENRSMDGRTLYRVRVGPYLSETEANYWLALVRSIDGFSDSQVRVSQVPVGN